MSNRALRRILAGLGAAALLAVALAALAYTALCVLFTSPPNPYEPAGDPCCTYSDTWGEVWAGIGWTLGSAAVAGTLLACAMTLAVRAVRTRWPRTRRLLLVPPAVVLLTALAVAITLHATRDEVTVPDGCHRSDLEHCPEPKPDD
jgi:hypothetical protein